MPRHEPRAGPRSTRPLAGRQRTAERVGGPSTDTAELDARTALRTVQTPRVLSAVVDRHALWRNVEHDFRELTKLAPEGYEPVVQVSFAGRVEPVELGWVRTRKDAPWIRFEAANAARSDESETAHADDFWIHVHEGLVERVEIRFRRIGRIGERRVGFRHTIADDADADAAPG